MLININPSDGTPIFIQIKDQIKNLIAGGILQTGDKLPSVRELSRELTVNPNTISKAYRELENEGILEKERGVGMFVAERARNDLTDAEKIFEDKLARLFVEAYHLGITKDKLKKLFLDYLEKTDLDGGKL